MSNINVIDRRKNPGNKSSGNRQRFLKRIEDQIKGALPDIIKNNNVKDISSSKEKVKVPIKGIKEPEFSYDNKSGDKKYIHPGNKEYTEGDRIKKPNDNGGGPSGRRGSKDDVSGEDEFTVTISREEFLDYFFQDLELPDMVKKHLSTIIEWKQKRAGQTQYGNPSRLNVISSYKNSMSRRLACGIFFDKKIKELEDKLLNDSLTKEEIKSIEMEITRLKMMKSSVSFMEEVDLRYNNYEKFPIPTTQAVMICIMDVSGSMTEFHKDLGKRFFMLLYMFLTKQYEKIEIVFIRHHTESKEVSEKEFFESRESGGTIVAPAIKLASKIIDDRYSSKWNIYLTQVSDGDVWDSSDAEESRIELNNLLTKIQYAWYVEVSDREEKSDLITSYKKITAPNFNFGVLYRITDIWPLFKDFFSKKK